VSRRNQDGATALTWARRGGSIDIETMLKRRGAQ
jgi:hypothetical protein